MVSIENTFQTKKYKNGFSFSFHLHFFLSPYFNVVTNISFLLSQNFIKSNNSFNILSTHGGLTVFTNPNLGITSKQLHQEHLIEIENRIYRKNANTKKKKYEESKKIARITYPDSFFQFTHEQVYALFEKHIEHLHSIATGLCKSSHPRVYWRHEQYFNGRKGKKIRIELPISLLALSIFF